MDHIVNAVDGNDAIIGARNNTLVQFVRDIRNDDEAITYCAQKGLISNRMPCENCHNPCRLNNDPCIDGKKWRCRPCNKYYSIRKNSIFEGSHLKLWQVLAHMHLWCDGLLQKYSMRQCRIGSQHTISQWAKKFRNLCSLELQRDPPRLGGLSEEDEGVIVEIDESLFGSNKRGRGQQREGKWVFGAIERHSGKCMMALVPNRNRQTLEGLISQWCEPGTRIISDGWAAYNNLDEINNGQYTHDVVIHERFYVDPLDNIIHTNTIEGHWAHTKLRFRRMYGTTLANFTSYLNEIIWMKNSGPNKLGELYVAIRRHYIVNV